MEAAIEACRKGMSMNKAAKTFGVGYSTLHNRINGKHQGKHGKKRKFSVHEEQLLAHLLFKAADSGVPLTKEMLRRIIIRICKSKGLPDGRFSREWLNSFLSRHPQLSQRIGSALKKKKEKAVDESAVDRWEEWIALLAQLHSEGYLLDPDGIFYLDEKELSLSESLSGSRRGKKALKSHCEELHTEVVTVLVCGNASGMTLRPAILFQGTMDDQHLSCYVRGEVIPQMRASKNILFVDAHSSHTKSEELLISCMETDKDIKMICIPAEHIDKLHEPTKKYWNHFLRSQSTDTRVPFSKQDFATLLMEKWKEFKYDHHLKLVFQQSGIFPFNPSAFRPSKTPEPQAVIPSQPLTVAEAYAAELNDVRTALRKIHPLSPHNMERVIDLAVRLSEGFVPEVPDSNIATDLLNAIANRRPPEKRTLEE